jgi:hypothetical protein
MQYWPSSIAMLGDWEPSWPQMLVFVDGLQFSNFYPEDFAQALTCFVRSTQKEDEPM